MIPYLVAGALLFTSDLKESFLCRQKVGKKCMEMLSVMETQTLLQTL